MGVEFVALAFQMAAGGQPLLAAGFCFRATLAHGDNLFAQSAEFGAGCGQLLIKPGGIGGCGLGCFRIGRTLILNCLTPLAGLGNSVLAIGQTSARFQVFTPGFRQ